jgi:putative endonuclease
MKEHRYWTYILASKRNGTLYTGVTNDLFRRVTEHKAGEVKGFTQKYKVNLLVWHEEFQYIQDAIKREKQLKKYYRKEKLALIENSNPDWQDLYEDYFK